jgi:CspA family cold shock protein
LASLQIHQSTISSIAERIVQARRLYGADSPYVIGMFQGLDLLLADSEAAAAGQQIQNRVVNLEGDSTKAGDAAPATKPSTPQSKRSDAGRSEAGPNAGEVLAENTWIRGAVKWFNNDKGYGFISTAADADVFVHWRDISSWDRSLTQGDEVEFMVTKTAKGFQAINVMKPGSGERQAEVTEAAQESSPTETSTPPVQAPPTAAPAQETMTPAEVTQAPAADTTADQPPPAGPPAAGDEGAAAAPETSDV